MGQQEYKVNIIGLSLNTHVFDFQLGNKFFEVYGQSLLNSGNFAAKATLDKSETMIEAKFQITGTARLACDRSLELFDYPMNIEKTILFKYGQEEKELSDEIVLITRDQSSLDLGQYLYELIGISLPMKRLHPKFQQEGMEESDIQLIYSTPLESNKDEDAVDPRWEKLRKLK